MSIPLLKLPCYFTGCLSSAISLPGEMVGEMRARMTAEGWIVVYPGGSLLPELYCLQHAKRVDL